MYSLFIKTALILALSSLTLFSLSTRADDHATTIITKAKVLDKSWKHFSVKSGDNLSTIFRRAGLSATDVQNISNSTLEQKTFVRMIPGETLSFQVANKSLQQLRYKISARTTRIITRVAKTNHYLQTTEVLQIPSPVRAPAKPVVNNDVTEPASNQKSVSAPLTQTQTLVEDSPSSIEPTAAVIELTQVLNQASSETDNWVYYSIADGDSLSSVFEKAGISPTDMFYVNRATTSARLFRALQPGQKLAFLIRSGHLVSVKYIINSLKNILITRTDKTHYAFEVFERKPVTKHIQIAGNIKNSLFVDALNAGLSNNMTMNFAKVFAWDVDFSQDLHAGDAFKVVYEELSIDGNRYKDGNIVAAQFDIGGQNLIGIFYRDTLGGVGFYTPEGRSMRKAFLRMPVEFARISSKFNLRRKHPILNRIRAHKGVDYAAKRGTPIMASGNGKIVYRGRRGDFGNTIIIQHGTSINTLYAHMSGFNSAFKVGSRVQQGQVIGYVGATGAVTGPHLHYEFRVDGVHKNPLTIKLPKAIALDPKELAKFKVVAKVALEKLDFETIKVEEEDKEDEVASISTTSTL